MDSNTIEALELARPLLPLWVAWGSVAAVALTAAAVATAGGWLAGRIALRAARGVGKAPWPERARLVYAAKRAMGLSCLVTVMLCVALAFAFDGPFSVLSQRGLAAVAVTVAFAVAAWRYRSVAQQLRPVPLPLLRSLRGGATFVLLFAGPSLLLLPALLVMPSRLDARALLVTALTAIAIGAFNCGLGLRLAIALRLVVPGSPRACAIAAAAGLRAGIVARKVYELRWPSANAVAFPLAKAVAFSDGALENLSDAQLEAICAHELGHLAEPASIVALRAIVPTAFAPVVLIAPLVATFGALGAVPIAAWVFGVSALWARFSRRLEEHADAAARGDVGGPAYARALERLYEVNLVPVVLSRRTSHPHLYDRMLAAGVEPSYPRPDPPPPGILRRALVVSVAVSVVLVLGVPASLVGWVYGRWQEPTRLNASLLLSGTTVAPRLGVLAGHRRAEGDVVAARELYRAAAGLERYPWSAAAYEAMALVLDERCDEARALLSGARQDYCDDCPSSDGPTPALLAETAALVCGTPAAAYLSAQ